MRQCELMTLLEPRVLCLPFRCWVFRKKLESLVLRFLRSSKTPKFTTFVFLKMTTHSGGTHEVHLVTTSMRITKVPAHVQISTRLKKSPVMFDLEL